MNENNAQPPQSAQDPNIKPPANSTSQQPAAPPQSSKPAAETTSPPQPSQPQSPQPAPPTKTPKGSPRLTIFWISLLMFIIGIICGVLLTVTYPKFAAKSQSPSPAIQISSTPTPSSPESASSSISPDIYMTPAISTSAVHSSGVDITGWKIYTNTKYGFSLKYPADLIVNEKNILSRTIEDEQIQSITISGKSFDFTIDIEPNQKMLSINDWLEEQRADEEKNCQIDCFGFSGETEEITIANQKALLQFQSSVLASINIYICH